MVQLVVLPQQILAVPEVTVGSGYAPMETRIMTVNAKREIPARLIPIIRIALASVAEANVAK